MSLTSLTPPTRDGIRPLLIAVFTPAVLALVTSASTVMAQDRLPTTGPPSAALDRGPQHDRSLLGPGFSRSGPQGSDILVSVNSNEQQNETSISVNPLDPDNWVVVANDMVTGQWETGWYTTMDGGQTWTTGTLGLLPGFQFSGDPVVAFDPDGDVHIVTIQYNGPGGRMVISYSSRDGGLNWETGVQISLHPDNDKPQIGIDLSDSPNRGHITVAWDRYDFVSRIGDDYTSTSKDGGRTWSAEQRFNDDTSRDTISPDVVYGPNGELYIMWADVGGETIWLDQSSDGGATWGTDQVVTTYTKVPTPIPGSNFRIAEAYAMAADWSDGPYSGNLYVVYHTWKAAGHVNVECAVSSDGGQTWTTKKVHKDGGAQADQFFPAVDVDAQGNVNVKFYDRRLDPNNLEIWTWVARSSDGGVTWTDHQISDVGWDHLKTEQRIFIGDYSDIDATHRRVIPVWCDGRTRSQDIMADIVTLDLFTDVNSISAATGGVVQVSINVGPNSAGAPYHVVGTFSGTSPGIDFANGVNLPINFDAITLKTLQAANTAFFQNFRGTLDATGSAVAVLDTQGPFSPAVVGLDLDLAVLVLNGAPTYGSNPTRITIAP